MGKQLFNPTSSKIDLKLVIGAFCFGLGWGIGGLCPGPAIMQFSVFTLQIQVVWFGCMVIGMHLAKRTERYFDTRGEKNSERLELKENAIALESESPRIEEGLFTPK
jgi:uncharacterized membrane protein YedE/YeeE